jgi:uncharacterized protein (DUF983 family)
VLTCPHCHDEICLRELPHQGFSKSFRICPGCGGSFTPDKDTKYRQAILIVIAVISLILTLFLYFDSTDWLIPAVASYVVFALLLYWGNKRVFLVVYHGKGSERDGGKSNGTDNGDAQ